MLILQKDNNNKGLFASQNYKKNEKLHKLYGIIYDKPSRTTIEISENKHIDDDFGIYMNHSFSPNCKIENSYIVALHDINEKDELTFNYNENETYMACPFIDFETKKQVKGKQE